MHQIEELFLDNYRGFSKSHIPMAQVSFLVGENSTGKTSFLKLLDLLSSSDFWFNGDFRNENVDFDYYGDLAENTHKSRTTICVLYGDGGKEKNKAQAYSFAKIVLQSGKNNRTCISELNIIADGFLIRSRLTPGTKTISYSITKNITINKEDFLQWCEDKTDPTTLKQFKGKLPPYFRANSPYFIINAITKNLKDDDITSAPLAILNTIAPFSWIAPIRVKPKQTYDGNIYEYSPDGAHTPYTLRSIFDQKKTSNSSETIKALEEFGQTSGLFDSLASKRYSKEGNAPFAIDIVRDGKVRHITDVGYGVSQVLPILVSVIADRYSGRYEIQQPEVHLHPKAQASLGSLFYTLAESKGTTLVIETHSDFIIDRYRQHMSKSHKKNKPKSHVLFFENNNGVNNVNVLKINSDGTYPDDQPDSYRRFFLDEGLSNLAV